MEQQETGTEGLIDSGSRCVSGHTLWLVAEGYALCVDGIVYFLWSPWRLTPPIGDNPGLWDAFVSVGRDDTPSLAWVGPTMSSKAAALAFIQADMDAHRGLPFDEERERARLMPV